MFYWSQEERDVVFSVVKTPEIIFIRWKWRCLLTRSLSKLCLDYSTLKQLLETMPFWSARLASLFLQMNLVLLINLSKMAKSIILWVYFFFLIKKKCNGLKVFVFLVWIAQSFCVWFCRFRRYWRAIVMVLWMNFNIIKRFLRFI